MKYYEIKLTDSTATYYEECDHANGWYVRVKFWIFSRYVFVCSDCAEVIYHPKTNPKLTRKLK